MIKRAMWLWFIGGIWAFGLLLILTNNPFLQGFLFFLVTLMTGFMVFYLNDRYQERERWHEDRLDYRLSKTQAEEERTHEQLETLVETLSSGFMLLDYEGIFTMANKAAREFLSQFTLKSESIDQLKSCKPLYEAIYQSFITEKPLRKQVRIEDLTYDIQTSPLHQHNLFVGLIVILSDITQLKRAEQFQKQFTADITHELKTPLSAIMGSSELLLTHQAMKPEQQQEFIHTIHNEAKRLETLITDLLVISKMDRLDYELKKKPYSLEALLKESLESTKTLYDKKGLDVQLIVEDRTLYVDIDKMRQVFLNLLRNAAHYTDEGGVTVKTSIDEDFVRIDVSDTGIGIDASEKEHIFKRFYRIDEARSRDSGGSGLGLSIIKNVVLKHQGRIEVKSTKGKGSTFSVWLPLEKQP